MVFLKEILLFILHRCNLTKSKIGNSLAKDCQTKHGKTTYDYGVLEKTLMKKNKGFLIVALIAIALMMVFFLIDSFVNLVAFLTTDQRTYAYAFLKDVDKTTFMLEVVGDLIGLVVCIVGIVIGTKKASSESKVIIAPLVGICIFDLLGIIGPIIAIILTKNLAEQNGYLLDLQAVLGPKFFVMTILLSLSLISTLIGIFFKDDNNAKIKKGFGIAGPSLSALAYLIVIFIGNGAGVATFTFAIFVFTTVIIMMAIYNAKEGDTPKEETASASIEEKKEEDIKSEPSVDDTDWMQ